MELQVQEHRSPRLAHLPDQTRPGVGEKFKADFEGADYVLEFSDKGQRPVRRGYIQRYDDGIAHTGQAGKYSI